MSSDIILVSNMLGYIMYSTHLVDLPSRSCVYVYVASTTISNYHRGIKVQELVVVVKHVPTPFSRYVTTLEMNVLMAFVLGWDRGHAR